MVTIYVIQSISTQKLYVGITEDLLRRLDEHNAGKSKYTSSFRPWKVMYNVTAENLKFVQEFKIKKEWVIHRLRLTLLNNFVQKLVIYSNANSFT